MNRRLKMIATGSSPRKQGSRTDRRLQDSRLNGGAAYRNGSRLKRCAGFTLFEMVIAVSIFALMGVMAFGGLGQMTRTGHSVADANNRLSELQFAVVYFTRDWTQVSARRIRDQYGDEQSNIVIDGDSVTFTRSGWSNLLGKKRSTLQRVQYLVIGNQLLRRYWRSLDQGVGEEPVQMVMLDGVGSMEVLFQNQAGQPIRVWPPETGSSDGDPILLAFKLELLDYGDVIRLLEVPKGVI